MRVQRQPVNAALLSGLGLALLTLLFFGWLAEEALAGRTAAFDMLVRGDVHRLASPALTRVMRALTLLGSAPFLIALALFLIARWRRQGRKRLIIVFLVTMLGAIALDAALKLVFHRPRPVPFFGLTAPASSSFPSGHALMSCCFYGVLAGVMARGRWWPWAAAALLVAGIGLSRIYLGVHYPSDVIAGYAAAVVWVLAVRSACYFVL
ncbi:MAG: phosphatase PAP2 family protein [Bryobacteraceae bacterium]